MDTDALYRAIVESSPDAIWVTDLDGSTLYANPQMASLFGVATPADMDGVTMFDTLDELGREQYAAHLAVVKAGRYNSEPVECLFLTASGEPHWVLLQESPLVDATGTATRLLYRITPFDEHRRITDELEQSRSELAEAQRIARVGSFRWDLATGTVRLSEVLTEMVGFDSEPFLHPAEDFLDLVHPDDRRRSAESIAPLVEHGRPCEFLTRVRTREGYRSVRMRAVGRTDTDGRVTLIEGTAHDVSGQVAAEEALQDQVTQNTLMQLVASAANEANTLDEILKQGRDLVLLHDDWCRTRGFRVVQGDLTPLYVDDADREDDLANPSLGAADLALARRVLEHGDLRWDEARLSIGYPIRLADEIIAIVVMTSNPPLVRHQMIEGFVRQATAQLEQVALRERTTRELAEARDAAMTANQQKSDFLAMVSHEIRTPLNGVIGLNDLLLQTRLDDEQRKLATGAGLSGRMLLDLINDILDFSKIEAGQLSLERIDFDVRGVVEQVVRPLAETASGKGVALEVDVSPNVPEVLRGDPVRLSQVLVNLLGNAVKFTDQGRIDVEVGGVEDDGDDWVLEIAIRDTGIGIAPGVDNLFEPFQQANTSTTRTHGGTGLGLAISKEIVSLAGGEIAYTSEQGRGSEFRFTMQLAAPQGTQVYGRPQVEVTRLRPLGARRRILVVDDNPVNRMVAEGMVRALGHDVDVADDGLGALEALGRATYDAVLLDVQMPRLDGYATTRAVRADENLAELPVIAMTATAIDGERERCLASGMDDFLTKPMDPGSLSRALNKWLGHGESVAQETPRAGRRPGDLDHDRLDTLRDLVPGSTTYLDRAIANFLSSSALLLSSLETAVREDDPDQLRFHAHTLKGSAANLGAVGVAHAAERLERLAASGTTEGGSTLIRGLAEQLDRAHGGLRAYRATYDVAEPA